MAKMGAPRIPIINAPVDGQIPEKVIDYNQVVYWAEMQATQEEVAGSFRVSVETLNSRLVECCGLTYSELRKRVDGMAKMSLRRYQFEQAKRSAAMAIWLGKNWLGQVDKEHEEISVPREELLKLEDKIAKLEYQLLNETKQQTNIELQRSDCTVQHLVRCNIVGEDSHINKEADRAPS